MHSLSSFLLKYNLVYNIMMTAYARWGCRQTLQEVFLSTAPGTAIISWSNKTFLIYVKTEFHQFGFWDNIASFLWSCRSDAMQLHCILCHFVNAEYFPLKSCFSNLLWKLTIFAFVLVLFLNMLGLSPTVNMAQECHSSTVKIGYKLIWDDRG